MTRKKLGAKVDSASYSDALKDAYPKAYAKSVLKDLKRETDQLYKEAGSFAEDTDIQHELDVYRRLAILAPDDISTVALGLLQPRAPSTPCALLVQHAGVD